MANGIGPAPINNLPLGMLDFFALKNGGRYPEHLRTEVQPTIDYTLPYANAKSLFIFASANKAAGNWQQGSDSITATSPVDLANGAALVVPQNEIWLVLAASITWSMTAAAGQSADFYLSYTSGTASAGQIPFPMSSTYGYQNSVATPAVGGTRALLTPVWIPSNSEIRINWSGIVNTANVLWSFAMRLARYQV